MKRFLMYLMTYILITFSTAFGVVLISNPTKATNQTINVGGTSSVTEAESPLTYIVDNFTTLKGLNLNANVDLVINGQPINLLANVTIDLNNGFENVALGGTLTVTLNGNATNVDFTYVDSTIYLSMLNGNYKITTNNLIATVNQILTLLNIEIPDMGLDLENLDLNSLLGLLNNVTETKTETGTTLSVYIPGLGNASVFCDLNYQIKQITLPKTTLNGFTFKVNVDASYPQNCLVTKPETNPIDLTHVFNLAEGLANFVSQNKIAVNAVVDYNGYTFNGNLIADIENKNTTFNTLIDNKPLNVTLISNVLYVEFENIFVKADLTRINEVISLFEQQLGISLPLEEISVVMTETEQIEVNTNQFSLENFDINNIDLGVLEKFDYNDGVYHVVIKDTCALTFTFNNHNFNNITFVGYGANAKLTAITPTEIKLNQPEENYVNVYETLPALNAMLNTLKLQHHFGTLSFNVNEQTINANYNIYINNGLTLELTTNILDTPITLNVKNNKIYLSFMDINVVCDADDVNEIKNFVNKYFEISKPQINLTDIKETINYILDSSTLLISEFEATENNLNLEVLSKYKINVNHSDLIESLAFETNGIKVSATVNSDNTPLALNITEENYVKVSTIFNTINNLVSYVKNGKYYFNTTLTLDNYTLNGFVNVYNVTTNNAILEAQLTTQVLGKNIAIKLVNNVVYLEIDGLNLKVALNDVEQLITFVENNFGVTLANVVSQTTTELGNIKLPSSLEGLNLKLTNNNFEITYNNALVNIDLTNNTLQSINVNYDNINANIELTNNKQNVNLNNNYINVIDLLPFAESVINTINADKLEGTVLVIVDNFALNAKFKVAFKDDLQVWIQTQINGATIKINYYKEQILVSIDDLHLSAGADEFDKVIELLNTTFGINVSSETITQTASALNIEKLLNTICLGDFANIGATQNTFGINTFGINVFTQFNEYLNSINVTYNNIYADVKLKAFNDDVYMPIINTLAYEPITYLLEAVKTTKQGIEGKNASISGNVVIKDFELPINLKVLCDETLKLELDTTIYNKNLNLVLIDETIYATIDGFKVKYNLNSVNELISLINTTFNINLNEELNKLTSTDINLEQTLKDLVIYNLSKTNFNDGYTLNLALIINEELVNLNTSFENNQLNNIALTYNNISANLNVNFGAVKQIEVNENDYTTDLNDLTTLITPVNNLVNTTAIELNGTFKFDLLGYNRTLTINKLQADWSNLNNIKLNVSANFLGFDVNVKLQNNVIYVGIADLKTYIEFNEIEDLINWINDTFNQNIELPKTESVSINISEETIKEMLNSFTLGDVINKIYKTPNGLFIDLFGYYNSENLYVTEEVLIDYSDTLTKAIINLQQIWAEINIVAYNENVNIAEVNKSDYVHYNELTTMVTNVYDYFMTKQYNFNANALVYNGNALRYDAKVNLSVDLTNHLLLSGNANLTGEQDISFDLNYWNEYLFVNYNNLKLKICEQDIKELLAIILNLLGVDPSIIPFLTDVAEDLDNINFDSISGLIPEMDSGDPLTMLNIISNIGYNANLKQLKLVFDGSQLSDNPNAKEMEFNLSYEGKNVKALSLTNIYTGVTNNEFFNLNVTFDEFNGVAEVTDEVSGTYHDLSGATELIKAVINTAELDYYHVTATVNVVGTLLGFIDIDWDIPLDIKIELDQNRMPRILMTLGEIPTMVGVNKAAFESVSNRMFYLCYMDSYFYLYRTETKSSKFVEYKLKLHIDDVLSDPLYVLQFGTGFTDDIMSAIYDSLEKGKGHTPDPGNVLNYFSVKDNVYFELQLNMEEITNDPLMGDMTIGLGVINNESTNNKNYVGNATFNMNMPLAENVFELVLSSDNLALVDIGKPLDLSVAYNFVNSYPYNEGEEYIITDGVAELASLKQYTITFNENGGSDVSDITAVIDSAITIPNYTELRYVVDESARTRTYYRFEGWYENSEFKGNKFTKTTMPRGGATLYAKWVVDHIEYVRTITFNSNGGSSIENVSEIAGVWIDVSYKVPTKENTYVDEGYNWVGSHVGKWTYKVTTYTFAGWYTDSSLTTKFDGYVPDYNTTLYAKWDSNTTTEYYYNWERP